MAGNVASIDADMSMATRAAWLHYAGGLTQSDVAKRLGLSTLKAHRLINRANQEGLVKVFIDGDVADCVSLESRLSQLYGLDYAEVVPDFDLDDLPLRALGIAGAQFLRREIESGRNKQIGVGHGRSLAACVDLLPRTSARGVRFVSLLGGLTQNFAASPHDVIHRLAHRTGAEAFVMPVPFYANTTEDRDVLLGQRGIQKVADLARYSDLMFVGIGTAEPVASLVATGMIEPNEIMAVREAGGVGELLGHFFDRDGGPVNTPLSDRTMSPSRSVLENSRIVAVAGGKIKTCAIRSILMSGILSGLITDERTAHSLVNDNPS